MSIEPVSIIKGQYNFSYAKNPDSKIFAPLELHYNIYGLIQKNRSKFEHFGNIYNLPLKFAPKGESTLMNIGPYTTIFKNSISSDEFSKHIDNQFSVIAHDTGVELYSDPLSKRLRWAENVVSKMEKLFKIKI